MSVNLFNQYNEALSNLLKWRNRYDKTSYAGKVVQNIFYGNLTMEILCGAIPAYFDGQLDKMNFENFLFFLFFVVEEQVLSEFSVSVDTFEFDSFEHSGNVSYWNMINSLLKVC